MVVQTKIAGVYNYIDGFFLLCEIHLKYLLAARGINFFILGSSSVSLVGCCDTPHLPWALCAVTLFLLGGEKSDSLLKMKLFWGDSWGLYK